MQKRIKLIKQFIANTQEHRDHPEISQKLKRLDKLFHNLLYYSNNKTTLKQISQLMKVISRDIKNISKPTDPFSYYKKEEVPVEQQLINLLKEFKEERKNNA